MKHIINILIVCLLIIVSLLFNIYTYSQQTNNDDINLSDYNNIDVMPLSEVKRGMEGYGYSIFSGSVAEKFDVEVLGIIEREMDTNIIMVRLSNNEWIEKGNVSKGMSGSPVFIDGKLIGAVALTYKWVKEPLGFLRPIEEMLELLDRKNLIEEEKKDKLELVPLETVMSKNFWKDFNNSDIVEETGSIGEYLDKYSDIVNDTSKQGASSLGEPTPIITPVMVSGISDDILDSISDEFLSYGFELISAGEGSSEPIKKNPDSDIKPGDTIGLQYMRGDINAHSIGTVTYRKDDKVLFFGHKSLNVGKMDVPLIKGFIYTTVPLQSISFKYGRPIEEIGKATYDFKAGVVGELGTFSKMIPVSVNIKNGKVSSTNDSTNSEIESMNYNFEIFPNYLFFSGLFYAAVQNVFRSAISEYGEHTTEFNYSITVKNHTTDKVDTVTIKDFISSGTIESLDKLILYRVIQPTQILMHNYYADTEILSLNFEATIDHQKQVGYIEDVTIPDNKIYAGKEASVLIDISTEHGETIRKEVKVKVPEYLKEGQTIAIRVSNRKGLLSYLANKNPSLMKYGSYERLLDILSYEQDYSELVVWIASIDNGFIVEGEEYPDLPESLQNIFRNHNKAVSYKEYSEPYTEKLIKTNYLITGYKRVIISLKGKE